MRFLLPILLLLVACDNRLGLGGPTIVEDHFGLYRLIHGDTACHSRDGINPMAWIPYEEPVAGSEVRVLFTTKAMEPFPDVPLMVFVSFRPLADPIDFTPFGMPGCWSLINLDITLPSFPGWSEGTLERSPGSGEVLFSWTPPPAAAGTTVYLQALVADKDEFLATPAVEIIFRDPQ